MWCFGVIKTFWTRCTRIAISASLWTEHRFISFDKTPIFYQRRHVPQKARAVFFIVHGMGEHGGRYREFCDLLATRGIESFIPDLRGFGRSGGPRGSVRRVFDYFQDLNVVVRLARESEPGAPIFVLGHSFGGLLVSTWLSGASDQFRGLILSSPNFEIAIQIPLWRHTFALLASRLFPDMTQDNRVDATKLTHDAVLSIASSRDPLIHHRVSARLYTEMVRMIALSPETASQLKIPALVLQAGEDHIVSSLATRRFFDALSSSDKEFELYDGFYHEIMNEVRRSEVFDRVLRWVEKRI